MAMKQWEGETYDQKKSPKPRKNSIRGKEFLPLSQRWDIGTGSFSAHTDINQGLWLGSDNASNAPFSIGMSGTVTIAPNLGTALYIQSGSDIVLNDGGDIYFDSVSAPGACTASQIVTASGSIDNGTYSYKIVYITRDGHTELGTTSGSVVVDAAHKQVALTAIPTSSSVAVTGRSIYRTKSTDTTNYYYVVEISDNSTTTYTDNLSDGSIDTYIGTNLDNTAYGKIKVDDIRVFLPGVRNTFIGRYAGENLMSYNFLTGYDNVGVGGYALNKTTYGSGNVGLGYAALYTNTIGIGNTAIGHSCLYYNTGSYNTGVGYAVMNSNSSGSYNTAMGYKALNANTTGYYNTAVGYYALNTNSSGVGNVAIGYGAVQTESSAIYNVGIGVSALYTTTGSWNVAVGNLSQRLVSSGTGNTTLGHGAAYTLSTGMQNTFIGLRAGYSNATGTGNVYLGSNAGYDATDSNKLYVANSSTGSPLLYGDFSGTAMVIWGTLRSWGTVRIDQAASSGTFDSDSYFIINLNGTDYKIPCVAV